MARFRRVIAGFALAAALTVTPVGPAQAVPLVARDLAVERLSMVHTVIYRDGTGLYRPNNYHYRPYNGYRSPGQYRPYYGYRPPAYRPYFGNRPYTRPGVRIYTTPRTVDPDATPRAGSHVNWCQARYRSYNPATDRFLTYGGVYKLCQSPYR